MGKENFKSDHSANTNHYGLNINANFFFKKIRKFWHLKSNKSV